MGASVNPDLKDGAQLAEETHSDPGAVTKHEEAAIPPPQFDEGEVRRARRKIDFHLLPMLTLLYLLAFIDRGNIGNARIAGMNDDLELTQTQYNICLSVGGPEA